MRKRWRARMTRTVDMLLGALGFPKGRVDSRFAATVRLPVVFGIGDGGNSNTARHTVAIANTVLTQMMLAVRARRLPVLFVRLHEPGTTSCCIDADCRAANPEPKPVYGNRADDSTCHRVSQCGHCGRILHRDIRAALNMADTLFQIVAHGIYHLPSFCAGQARRFAP